MRRERREEARCDNEGEEHMRKHEGTTDRQRGEHRRQLKDKRHKRAWKFKGNTQGNLKDTRGQGKQMFLKLLFILMSCYLKGQKTNDILLSRF